MENESEEKKEFFETRNS